MMSVMWETKFNTAGFYANAHLFCFFAFWENSFSLRRILANFVRLVFNQFKEVSASRTNYLRSNIM